MRRMLLLALALTLLCACAPPAEEAEGARYELFYASEPSEHPGGDAIASAEIRLNDPSQDSEALARRLAEALLDAPEDAGLLSPFPEGTRLRKLTVARGRATVDLSAEYARLSGVDLSIADYCLTLTLTQLPGIYAVRITADGRELPYRKTQLLTAADPLLTSGEDPLRPINVSLYFLDVETGTLRSQQQTLALYEGQSRASAVLNALLRGPEGDESLRPLLPPDFAPLSVGVDGGICYVNLSADAALPAEEPLRALALDSVVQSLSSLSGVDEVHILTEGEEAFAPEALSN